MIKKNTTLRVKESIPAGTFLLIYKIGRVLSWSHGEDSDQAGGFWQTLLCSQVPPSMGVFFQTSQCGSDCRDG